MIKDIEKLEKDLNKYIKSEKNKIKKSIDEKISSKKQHGYSQTIGRNYGKIWENIVKIVLKNDNNIELKNKIYYKDYVNQWIEENIATLDKKCCKTNSEIILKLFLEENTSSEMRDLCDFTFKYKNKVYAVDTKYKFNSNDSNTVREIANSGIYLKNMGYIPILLIRTNKQASQKSPILRFEKNGWEIKDDNNAIDFIKEITGYNLNNWISKNLNIWNYLKEYQVELEKLGYGKEEWNY